MSGNWAWDQVNELAQDRKTHGAMFAPIILGSDKTTVSVETGQNEYYPLYASLGNVQNHVHRAHCDALTAIGFLALPKADKEYGDSAEFHKFWHQLFHMSLEWILQVIFGIGPYIADYSEQSLLTCIVSGWCPKCIAFPFDLDNPWHTTTFHSHDHTEADEYGIIREVLPSTTLFERANIHKLIALNLPHQIIKGTFKDHLIDWVILYIKGEHEGEPYAVNRVIAELDHRIATVAPFAGDDSKGLMKVFLPVITGLVPSQIVHALSAFLEFCYLVWCSNITEDILEAVDNAVEWFHKECQIFQETESKHIKAVKEPWHHSSQNKALGQMLLTNQQLDKISTMQIYLEECGLLQPSSTHSACNTPLSLHSRMTDMMEGDDVESIMHVESHCSTLFIIDKLSVSGYPKTLQLLSVRLIIQDLHIHIRHYLYDQLNPNADVMGMDVDLDLCPQVSPNLIVRLFHLATCLFHAPSDLSGIGGMHHEIIRMTPSWCNSAGHYDCVFIVNDHDLPSVRGLQVAQVQHFLSFRYQGEVYQCALVHWFEKLGDEPCEDTGLWVVQLHKVGHGSQCLCLMSIVHIDTILWAAHLIGVSGHHFTPADLKPENSLAAYSAFYVNKYADHHAHKTAF
ncbi:hypothetical protein BDQ17DRAFT_1391139 [Cyathus striatus]|nr:hypothetical protein BDQ17DRAFT_1391139 [Cyathus striatus]